MKSKIKKKIMSIYFVFLLITAGFIGILVIEGIIDEGSVAAATTRYVGGSGAGNYSTIQSAINAASAGDTIRVYAGTYNEQISVNKKLTLIGNGTTKTTINQGSSADAVTISADGVKFTGFKITRSGFGFYMGIKLDSVDDCNITYNNCSNHYYGIYLSSSSKNTIFNNTCNFNTGSGIYVMSTGNKNRIINNTCNSNNWYHGIDIRSSSNTIINNTCNSNSRDGIYVQGSSNRIMNNTCNSNGGDGIYVQGSSNIIMNNNCSNWDGIELYCSTSNTLKNNTMVRTGITIGGWQLNHWNSHTIDSNNTVNGKPVYYYKNTKDETVPAGAGQVILANCENVTVENQSLDNVSVGITLGFSKKNIIQNNICSKNGDGIGLIESSSNILDNNTCKSYDNGIYLDGLYKNSCKDNIISNCTISNNWYGIKFYYANSNIVYNCTISKNTYYGIYFYYVDSNTIYNCTISNNLYGIYGWGSSDNYFFHNNIISNTNQVLLSGTHTWNNSQQEGNYWSDYRGIDDGSGSGKHAIAGDGIGDTRIPHPGSGFDNYPYTQSFGWLKPAIPLLVDPGDLVTDGNYSIKWNSTQRTIGYILEEDVIDTFTSPIMIYKGPELNFDITYKPNGTYFYRLKAYDDKYESAWSNIVDIEVDWPPNAPTGLIAENPTGYEISLSWEPNAESDIAGYNIYVNDTLAGPTGLFHLVDTIEGPDTQYTVTELIEEITYYFVVDAYDEKDHNSKYSNVASATTLDVTEPQAPTNLRAKILSGTQINLTWFANPETDLEGYDIYINNTNRDQNGPFHIIDTISKLETWNIVSDLCEETTYHFKIKAFDEVPNKSSYSNVASATTPDETPPSAPTGLTVSNPTKNSLELYWEINPESDLVGYKLYRSLSPVDSFKQINSELLKKTHYLDTGLEEVTIYYYKLQAVDDVPLESDFSAVVFGTTILGPHPPMINNSIADFDIIEDTIDNTSINLYHWFSDINGDTLEFRCEGQYYIQVVIHQDNGTVILNPLTNWNGQETLTFYASDNVFNEVYDSVKITVIPQNDPPGPATILTPKTGHKIKDKTPVEFTSYCDDPDIQYGDEITFKWYSNISNGLGEGKTLEDIILPVGKHLITLEVSDRNGETSTTTITVTVGETPETDSDGDGMPNVWERKNKLNISDPADAHNDSDGDGISNIEEYYMGTNPQELDTDKDGLSDSDEINEYNTNPVLADSDADGYIDGSDDYPLDSTKWEEETPEKDDSWAILPVIVVVIIIIILIIFLLILKTRRSKKDKKEKVAEEKSVDISTLKKPTLSIKPSYPPKPQPQIQAPTKQYTPQYPFKQPTQQQPQAPTKPPFTHPPPKIPAPIPALPQQQKAPPKTITQTQPPLKPPTLLRELLPPGSNSSTGKKPNK